MSKFLFPFHAKSLCIFAVSIAALGAPLHALTININPDAGLSANPQALAAFQAAAAQWSSRISDPITINISAGLDDLGNNSVIGQTGSSQYSIPFDTVRNMMVSEAAGKPNNQAVTLLPTYAQYSSSVKLGAGTSLSGNMFVSSANAKALGFNVNPTNDATITFNSRFAFNYTGNPTNSQEDFQTVAAHEIGHALGFVSSVDSADGGTLSLSPTPLDLFRFQTADAPTSLGAFTAAARDLTAGSADVTSAGSSALAMSTGVAHGDGNQASHWKADEISGFNIGIMDPTLAYGQVESVGDYDLFAMDLIGYDLVAVPEPTTWLGGSACGLVLLWRLRRAVATC